jgi:hypothetical protein
MEVTLTDGTVRIILNSDGSTHKIHRINKFLTICKNNMCCNSIKHICETDIKFKQLNFYQNKIRKLPKLNYESHMHFGSNRIKSCKLDISFNMVCYNKVKDLSYCNPILNENKYLCYL